ncbi:MAG: ribosome maturation factor RimM [Anaerolineae bacterium]
MTIGRVVGVHGVRGEIKVQILTEDPYRFGLLKRVFIGLEGEEPIPWELERYRLHKGRALLKLAGCHDRIRASMLHRQLVQVSLDEALPLDEDEYYEYQIIGLAVWTVNGEHLGNVIEILETGANDVYVVGGPGQRDILIPAIEGVILQVDLDAGKLVVKLLEGLR